MLFGLFNYLITAKLRAINLFDYLSTAEKYDKVVTEKKRNTLVDFDHKNLGRIKRDVFDYSVEPVFISTGGSDADSTVVFYENLFMLFSHDKELNDWIVEIYMKRPEDEWVVPIVDNEPDFLNPLTVKVNVYVNYDVSVQKLNRRLSRCCGEEYKSGTWDKSFYRTLNSFLDKVDAYTELNQVKNAYKKSERNKK